MALSHMPSGRAPWGRRADHLSHGHRRTAIATAEWITRAFRRSSAVTVPAQGASNRPPLIRMTGGPIVQPLCRGGSRTHVIRRRPRSDDARWPLWR